MEDEFGALGGGAGALTRGNIEGERGVPGDNPPDGDPHVALLLLATVM